MADRREIREWFESAQASISPKKSENDLGTYEAVSASLKGAAELLEAYRSNQGFIGFGGANVVSDLTDEIAARLARDDSAGAEEISRELGDFIVFLEGLQVDERVRHYAAPGFTGALAEDGRSFFRNTRYQEFIEMRLVCIMWQVVTGKLETMPVLPTISEFGFPVQAILAAYVDALTEVGKLLEAKELDPNLSVEDRLNLPDRFLRVARSTYLVLSGLRHFPRYVVDNAYGRFRGFGDGLRRVAGMIAGVGRAQAMRLFLKALHDNGAEPVSAD